ncbi:MAG: replicative DNA helicase [Thermodesulfobacteriota bacterium]
MPAENSHATRLPPQFIEGEKAILGGLLIDNGALPRVMSVLRADDFYLEPHRHIYRCMEQLFERNTPVDWLTVRAGLRDEGRLEAVGGDQYLTGLADAVPSAANIMHYGLLVREKSVLRHLISATSEITTRCYQEHENIDEFLDEAEQLIFEIGQARIQSGPVHVHDLMKTSLQTVERLYERRENITGVPSGFRDLDEYTGGFQDSDLIIIAGRPSMGKTSLALNVAMSAAIEYKITTAIFSLEMSNEQIGLRMLCSKAKVNLRALRTGYLSKAEWPKLTTACGLISEAPIYVDDTPAINTLEIRAKARRLKKERNLGLVVVDYLQLMQNPTRRDSREKEISEISRSLKALAKELSVPVIALSQLNRQVEQRPNKRPQLADLRESGAIEQDADVILFIYRDEVYNQSPDNPKKGEAEIIIGKQRNGPIGVARVQFSAEYSTFRPFVQRDDEPREESGMASEI